MALAKWPLKKSMVFLPCHSPSHTLFKLISSLFNIAFVEKNNDKNRINNSFVE
jgi:hypothetical protein